MLCPQHCQGTKKREAAQSLPQMPKQIVNHSPDELDVSVLTSSGGLPVGLRLGAPSYSDELSGFGMRRSSAGFGWAALLSAVAGFFGFGVPVWLINSLLCSTISSAIMSGKNYAVSHNPGSISIVVHASHFPPKTHFLGAAGKLPQIQPAKQIVRFLLLRLVSAQLPADVLGNDRQDHAHLIAPAIP